MEHTLCVGVELAAEESEDSFKYIFFVDEEFKERILHTDCSKSCKKTSKKSNQKRLRKLKLISLNIAELITDKTFDQVFSEQAFTCGNASTREIRGLIHLYKPSESVSDYVSPMVCILGIPHSFENSEILSYLMQYIDTIEFVRIFADTSHSTYMALVKFQDKVTAKTFFDSSNEKQFNAIEEYICHLAYVGLVTSATELMDQYNVVEMPNCVVCLERMDKSNVVTVLCNHTYHMKCIAQWESNNCPVCRHHMTPTMNYRQCCEVCGLREQNWLCLICGFVGCGRYANRHSYEHFTEHGHGFFKNINTQDVWDYTEDRYVRRIVQSELDNKLVGVGSRELVNSEEKVDSIQLEYINQLDNQNICYQAKFSLIKDEVESKDRELLELKAQLANQSKQLHKMEARNVKLEVDFKEATKKVEELSSHNDLLISNRTQIDIQLKKTEDDMQEIKTKNESTVNELQEQLTDLLGHFSLQQQIPLDPDVRDGYVFQLGSASRPGESRRPRRRRR